MISLGPKLSFRSSKLFPGNLALDSLLITCILHATTHYEQLKLSFPNRLICFISHPTVSLNHRNFLYRDFNPDFVFSLLLGGAAQNIFCTQAVFNANRHCHMPLSHALAFDRALSKKLNKCISAGVRRSCTEYFTVVRLL